MTVEPLTPAIAARLGYRGAGRLVVTHVDEGGAADRAQIEAGDVIVEADRQEVRTPDQLGAAFRDGRALLRIERGGDARYTVITRDEG